MSLYEERKFWRGSVSQEYTIQLVRPPCSTVELVDAMSDPAQMMAKVQGTYRGVLSNDPVLEEAIAKMFEDTDATKLQTPAEMFYMVWLIKDVTRAFTHQLVRTRVGASFAQESMRFFGLHGVYKAMITHGITKNSTWTSIYSKGIYNSIEAYDILVEDGAPSEDARGVLPTNICTATFFGVAMSTLQHIYTQRMCCQAQQGEWQPILSQMRLILKNKFGKDVGNMLAAPYEKGIPCGYRASFDRPCIWQKTK